MTPLDTNPSGRTKEVDVTSSPTNEVAVTIPVTSKEKAVAIPRDDVCCVTTVEYSIPIPEGGYALPVSSRLVLMGVMIL